MSRTLFKEVGYHLSKLIHDIDHGDIGLPDLQRPFVWKNSQVRNLFDSMYKGFPVGYFLFWATDDGRNTRNIGSDTKQVNIPRLLIVDGQQRLTSLYAVLKGQKILNENYEEVSIQIAFRPKDGRFEVADAAIKKDPEYIADISSVWKDGYSTWELINNFLSRLRKSKEVSREEEMTISRAIDRLYNLKDYPFTAVEISSTVDEEQVSEIFVRINSQGKQLNQADFILTLLSVFWDEGRKELEEFSRLSRIPVGPHNEPTPYNHFIHPHPDQLLRVGIGLGLKRARLKNVYSVLRGKDLETGLFSETKRVEQFNVLKEAQKHVLSIQNWHDFFHAIIKAGFRSHRMISSETTIIYAYIMYLIGKIDYKIDHYQLQHLIARWFFMTSITRRYTSSPETVMERDLTRLRDVPSKEGFINVINHLIDSSLTNDFWNITLVEALETSTNRTPTLFAYYAALNLLDARVLFSNMKIRELMDPMLQGQRSPIERHHLFPKAYLKSIGIETNREINQIANYAFVEWKDNSEIADQSPKEYLPKYTSRFSDEELEAMYHVHALPIGWEDMSYHEFLRKRRQLMARIIKEGFDTLEK